MYQTQRDPFGLCQVIAMEKYSALTLLKHALTGHRHWPKSWRNAEVKRHYDVVIIGGGGHGLATAYNLAKNHGITKVAVLDRPFAR